MTQIFTDLFSTDAIYLCSSVQSLPTGRQVWQERNSNLPPLSSNSGLLGLPTRFTCHPGLDPGSIFDKTCIQFHSLQMPGQARHDKIILSSDLQSRGSNSGVLGLQLCDLCVSVVAFVTNIFGHDVHKDDTMDTTFIAHKSLTKKFELRPARATTCPVERTKVVKFSISFGDMRKKFFEQALYCREYIVANRSRNSPHSPHGVIDFSALNYGKADQT